MSATTDRIVEELRHELADLHDQCARISAAIAALVPVSAPFVPDPPATPELPHRCEECGDAFSTKQGLSMHRTRRHREPRTADELEHKPSPPPAIAGDVLALRCEDCDAAFPLGPIRPLAKHVLEAHGRHALLVTERAPRAAA